MAFLVLVMLVNCLVPRFSLRAKDYEVLSRIMENQTALISLLSFSSLPLKIVGDIFKKNTAPSSGKTGQGERGDETNTSSEYSIVAPQKSMNMSRYSPLFSGDPGNTLAARLSPAALSYDATLIADPPGSTPSVYLILLMFFFLLPRSSVGEGAPVFPRAGNITQLGFAKLGFFFAMGTGYERMSHAC